MNRIFVNLLAVLFLGLHSCTEAKTKPITTAPLPPLPAAEIKAKGLELATFAGGCFWCTEAVFERLRGVDRVISGYTGGAEKNPTYEQVGAGETGHAEAVQIYFDPKQVTYPELLEVFFATHDPTTLNRQGPDVGKQYRSAIFYHSEEQKQQALAYVKELETKKAFRRPIVTQLQPYKMFYTAEGYHQDYYEHNPNNPYVQSVTAPKVHKFEKQFRAKLKTTALKASVN
ncbi:peptide-methionine (S)-S-oxide reductase MsrA [Adhaeribacter pallidiroseus]|uniref:Peptide methionine sulfoxide reductase MsrA n=1 Tax=Adhaeribacter pallidiroseus TaxID=2072847 RepID=A0A369QRC1_9BACT|nr:peptide-methionine (S)-S-oxide reductase MsrA [Adhaeribacter pallidiroseus]RDC65787.1 Peptide-methionine (S)-S-oxide reductase [Adhaeribacter pallidiroseus]